MSFARLFPATTWIWRCVSSRWARRLYVAILVLLLLTTIALRSYVFVLTQRAQAVLSGLAKLRIDQSTEEELLRMVPHLEGGTRAVPIGSSVERFYYVKISNEPGYFALARFGSGPYPERWWGLTLAEWLGYRYFRLDAQVIVLDGKVSRVRYGISKEAVRPVEAGYIVSAKSFHGLWAPYQTGFSVSSAEDESPQFRIQGNVESLRVSFAFDAPLEVASRAFQVELGCFWGFLGCRTAREIAPGLWEEKQAIDAAVLARLQGSEPCPDRLVAGRARYLLDVSIVLLEVSRRRLVDVNEEGRDTHELLSDFKAVEVLRGRVRQTWNSVRERTFIPSPTSPREWIYNRGQGHGRQVGSQVLIFGNHYFGSCTVVPATASALAAIRESPPGPRRIEDQPIKVM